MKNELILQLLIIFLVAGIFSALTTRLYPYTKLLKKVNVSHQVQAEETISPLSLELISLKLVKPKVSPTKISIPKIGLDLNIEAAKIVDGKWDLFDDKASWLATSSVPGEGNVILYAHNLKQLFGRLSKTQSGDVITLEHNGKIYTYRVALKNKVSPTDVEAILNDGDQLTLYTCDGTFDQKRLVVLATPTKE